MPDSFPESPYATHPTIKGAALLTGHPRYAEWFREADHPSYRQRVASYRAMTERLNGIAPGESIPPPDLPPLLTRAMTFGKAVVRAVKAGVPTVTDEQHAERMATCGACPNKRGNTCVLCGCGLRAKARLATEKCPIGKWPSLGGASPGGDG